MKISTPQRAFAIASLMLLLLAIPLLIAMPSHALSTKNLSGDCLKEHKKWKAKGGYGAFALGATGACGWSYDADSLTQARSDAVAECRKWSKKCQVISEIKTLGRKATAYKDCGDKSGEAQRKACDVVLTYDKKSAWAYFKRGYSWDVDGQSDKAISDYSTALRLDPKDYTAFYNRGTLLSNRGEYEKALSDLDASIKIKPDFSSSHNNRGLALNGLKRYEEAKVEFEKAIKLDPKNERAIANIGEYFADKGDYDQSLSYYSDAIEVRKDYASAYNSRGYLLARLGRYDDAFADLARALALEPSAGGIIDSRGYYYLLTGKYDSARADFERALEAEPKIGEIHSHLGDVLAKTGSIEGAITQYEKALELDPMLDVAARGLKWARSQRTLPASARERPDWEVCASSLAPGRLQFSATTSNPGDAADIAKRKLSVNDCRATLGLVPLPDPAAAAAPPPVPNIDASVTTAELCTKLLHATNAADAVALTTEIVQRGITVEACQSPTPAVTAQAPVTPPAQPVQANEMKAPAPGARVALVLGNSDYQNSPRLANPQTDANAMAGELTRLGFTVILGTNLGYADTVAKIREFARASRTADISLLFYAGHGLQISGENYIVPIDAAVNDETAVSFELVNTNTITNFMGGPNRVGIVLLDACRDNPFSTSLKRSLSASRAASVNQGLAPISATGGGLFVAFATAPGDVAADGTGMPDSPFTTALLRHLSTPSIELNTVLTRVKADVAKMTKDDQRPWTNSDLTTEVYLNGR